MARKLGRGKPKKSAGVVLFVAVEGKTQDGGGLLCRAAQEVSDSPATTHGSQRWERARFRGGEISKGLAR